MVNTVSKILPAVAPRFGDEAARTGPGSAEEDVDG